MNHTTAGLRLAADAAIDLHLHTIYSDGDWHPEQLLDYLRDEGFALAAVSDHDRTDTIAHIQQLALDRGLPMLQAVEMSTTWQGEMTDILCYGFDPGHTPLDEVAQDLLRRQQENTREVFKNLQRQGYTLPTGSLPGILDRPSPVQPHALVALLKEHGYGLGDPSAGRIALDAGCAFASSDPAAIVDAAHRSGALCLLAHPGRGDGYVTYDEPLLDRFRLEAPVDGLEVYYPLHTPAQTEMFHEYAWRHGLLASAGSDSHRAQKPPIKYRADMCRDLLQRLGIEVG